MKRALGFMNKSQPVAGFVSTWNTANTSAGSSTSTQIKLPLYNGGTYNFDVDWGDSSSSTITAWNDAAVTHTYASGGTYTITITGTINGWSFYNTGDRLKITSIASWGVLRLGNNGGAFFGCTNLNLTSVSDVLDLTGTGTLYLCFSYCNLTTVNNMNSWDVSGITNMSNLFEGNNNFNENIGNWNVSNVKSFGNMFHVNFLFNKDISGWNVSSAIAMNSMFSYAYAFNKNIGAWNVSNVTSFSNFMVGKTAANFSTTNLDAIYNGWSSRPVKTPITITFGTAKYTAASSAGRAILTGAPNNWAITDGGI